MHFISVLLPLFLLSLSFLCHTQAYKVFLGDFLKVFLSDFLSLYKAPDYRYVCWLIFCTHVFSCVLGYLCTMCVHAHVANIVSVGGTQCINVSVASFPSSAQLLLFALWKVGVAPGIINPVSDREGGEKVERTYLSVGGSSKCANECSCAINSTCFGRSQVWQLFLVP